LDLRDLPVWRGEIADLLKSKRLFAAAESAEFSFIEGEFVSS
jgi:hypothetical protein